MRLAQAGKEVRLIEQRKIGGQCLHDRCMTVCALNDVARLLEYAQTQKDLGILDSVPTLSYLMLKRRMSEIPGETLLGPRSRDPPGGSRDCLRRRGPAGG